jgi:hypothetical protein
MRGKVPARFISAAFTWGMMSVTAALLSWWNVRIYRIRSGFKMDIPAEFKENEPKPETNVWSVLTKEAFIDAIEEVIKIEPITSKYTATYRFKFNFNGTGGAIEINVSDLMRSYKKFEELLFSHFDMVLPSKLKAKPAPFEMSEWNKFIQMCGQMCTKVAPFESTE